MPVAAATLKFIPSPNYGDSQFSAASSKLHLTDDKFSVRSDYNTQRLGNWSAYYSFDNTSFINPYPGKLGVVEEGAIADLLVVDGNPLEDIKLVADP